MPIPGHEDIVDIAETLKDNVQEAIALATSWRHEYGTMPLPLMSLDNVYCEIVSRCKNRSHNAMNVSINLVYGSDGITCVVKSDSDVVVTGNSRAIHGCGAAHHALSKLREEN